MAKIQEEKKGRTPDFKGDGVAVWVNKDKNGKQYLAINVTGHNSIAAFEYEKKE